MQTHTAGADGGGGIGARPGGWGGGASSWHMLKPSFSMSESDSKRNVPTGRIPTGPGTFRPSNEIASPG